MRHLWGEAGYAGPGTIGGGGDGKEVWGTATMTEEDNITAEAAELMILHNVPADFRRFVSRLLPLWGWCCGGVGERVRCYYTIFWVFIRLSHDTVFRDLKR